MNKRQLRGMTMEDQGGNGFKGIYAAGLIMIMMSGGFAFFQNGDVLKQETGKENSIVWENDSLDSAEAENEKNKSEGITSGEGNGETSVGGGSLSSGNDNIKDEDDKTQDSEKDKADDDSEELDKEESNNDSEELDKEESDDGNEDSDQDETDTEKSEVEIAIEAIKGGNIDSDEFKDNVLLLIGNGYTDSEIQELIDKSDSDNDGFPDHMEKIYETDKNIADTDGDGLSDGYEVYVTFTNPCLKDSDNNGVLDIDEDLDKDGLSNGEEFIFGTNPIAADSDEDGVNDFDEVKVYNTDPNNKDTDSDGLEDYVEIFITKTNPLSPDSENVVKVETNSSNSFTDLSIVVEGQAKNIWDLSVLELPEQAILSSERIRGIYGRAYDFSTLGEFDNCTVNINILNGKPGREYGLYYFNEEEGSFEEVKTQSYIKINGSLKAELEHFSKYVVLEKEKYYEATYDIRNIIQKAYERNPSEDSDKDGFNDAIDPTPISANFFASYNDYVRYFYGSDDIISVFVDQPVPGTNGIYKKNDTKRNIEVGHTFMAYTSGEEEYYSGLYPYTFEKGKLFLGIDTNGRINTYEGIYKLIEDGSSNNLVQYGGEFSEVKDYDKNHKWNVALPIPLSTNIFEQFRAYPRNFSKQYNLKRNNCTTYVLDFLKNNGIKTEIYNGDYEPSWTEEFFNYTGGTPGLAGYYIENKYPMTSVKNKTEWILNIGSMDVYYSQMSEIVSINVDGPLEDGYIPVRDNFTEFNGHYYGLIKIKEKDYRFKTEWDQAKAIAEELGGYLAVITSKEEDNFCYNLARDVYGISSCYFGLSDAKTEGVWEWVNGEEFDYNNWEENEPNNEGGIENYGMYYYKFGSSKWNDGNGDDGIGIYLVEFDKKPENFK